MDDARGSSDTSRVDVGAAIRVVLKEVDVTQEALAELIGFDQSTVAGWVAGRGLTSVSKLPLIEDALTLPRGYILTLAGAVEASDVEKAIAADPRLTPTARRQLRRAYEAALDLSVAELR